jgi:hypothetical protein
LTEIGDAAGELLDADPGEGLKGERRKITVGDGGLRELAGGQDPKGFGAKGGDNRGIRGCMRGGLGRVPSKIEEQLPATVREPDVFPVAAADHALELACARSAKHANERLALWCGSAESAQQIVAIAQLGLPTGCRGEAEEIGEGGEA